MKDKRVIGYFAAGFLIAVALGGIYVLVKGPIGPMSGDDDRVIVAGGSLRLDSRHRFIRDPQDKQRAIHIHPWRTVAAVEVFYWDGKLAHADLPGGPVKVEIDYCKGANFTCANPNIPDDVVTLETTLPNGTGLVAHNSSTDNPMGDEAGPGGSTGWKHKPDDSHAIQIKVRGVPYKCYQGSCWVKFHYCSTNGPGDCQP